MAEKLGSDLGNGRPVYILKFEEAVLSPERDTLGRDILVWACRFLAAVCAAVLLLFGGRAFRELVSEIWFFAVILIALYFLYGKSVQKPCPCEIWFYDDRLEHHCERRVYTRWKIWKEYYTLYYQDIERIQFRPTVQRWNIFGHVHAVLYEYDRKGRLKEKPFRDKEVDGGSTHFYSHFAQDIDFAAVFEKYTPLKVEVEGQEAAGGTP